MNLDDWFDKEMARLDEMLDNGEITYEQYKANEKEIRAQYQDERLNGVFNQY
jgi:hypothetical protein